MNITTIDEKMSDADDQSRGEDFKTVTIEDLLEMYK